MAKTLNITDQMKQGLDGLEFEGSIEDFLTILMALFQQVTGFTEAAEEVTSKALKIQEKALLRP